MSVTKQQLESVQDLNKGITSIAYNHLNLPKLITKGDSTIHYVYDATGIKLQKKVSKNGTVVKTTDYVGALVYEGTADKFLHTEEGRVVLKENGETKEEYQYHLKDHLGNVRVTFTTANNTDNYLATMENAFADLEGTTFNGLETRQTDVLYNKTPGGSSSARLNALENRVIGPSMSLSVMPGDTVDMKVYAKYNQTATQANPLPGLIAIVAGAFTNSATDPEGAQLLTQALQQPLGAANMALFKPENNIPKAYLQYLFFDRHMGFKSGGFIQVGPSALGAFEELNLDFAPQEEGYLLVYVANQSDENLNVYFDDMEVNHITGPIVRVDDYYPFGMAFNTGTLTGELTNKYLYNGKELQQELGLDWYDYGARMYDAQLGRWFTIDPRCEDGGQESISPYTYVFNDPIKHNDPDGKFPGLSNIVGGLVGAAVEYGGQVAVNMYNEGGWSWDAFTDNIDVGDVLIAGGEGFITSGGSVVKNSLLKASIVVGAEITANYLDVKTSSDGSGIQIETNDALNTAKNTVIGLTVGQLGDALPAPKFMKNVEVDAPTPKQAVKEARSIGPVNKQQRIAIENKAKIFQTTASEINQTTTKAAQNFVGEMMNEILKDETNP